MGPPIHVLKRSMGYSGVPCEWNQTLSSLFSFSFLIFFLPLYGYQSTIEAVDLCIDSTIFCCMFPAMDGTPFRLEGHG